MEKNLLNDAVEANTNISTEFKENLKDVLNAFMYSYQDYDYTYFLDKIKSLNIKTSDIEGYTDYINDNNTLVINEKSLKNDGIDLSHLILKEVLEICSNSKNNNPVYKSLNNGLSDIIANTVIYDDSRKKENPVLFHEVALFTKIVNPDQLFKAFMSQDYSNVITELESNGISREAFLNLLNSLNKGQEDYLNTYSILANMYNSVLNTKKQNNTLSEVDMHKQKTFNDMFATKQDLINLYPYHNFNNLPVINLVKEEEMIKEPELIK